MDEVQYRSIIYGIRTKFKNLKQRLCKEKQEQLRKIINSIDADIVALIDDYEN